MITFFTGLQHKLLILNPITHFLENQQKKNKVDVDLEAKFEPDQAQFCEKKNPKETGIISRVFFIFYMRNTFKSKK